MKNHNKILFVLIISLIFTSTIPSSATPTNVYLTPTEDTCIKSATADTNYGNSTIDIGNWGGWEVGLIKFDLSGYASITSAELRLIHYSSSGGTFIIDVLRATSDWNEKEATWNNMAAKFDSNVFATDGSGTLPFVMDVTDLVKSWLNGTYENFGFYLNGNQSSSFCHYSFHNRSSTEFGPELFLTGEVIVSEGNIVILFSAGLVAIFLVGSRFFLKRKD